MAGLYTSKVFLGFQFVIVFLRLFIVIKARKALKRYPLFKEVMNKTIWFLYHLCFMFLEFATTDLGIRSYLYSVLILLLVALMSEGIFALIDLTLEVKDFLKENCCRSNKINIGEKTG